MTFPYVIKMDPSPAGLDRYAWCYSNLNKSDWGHQADRLGDNSFVNIYAFKNESDAVMFALLWSGK